MRKSTNPYYTGPVSDHFDGTRFFHPGHRVVNCTSDFFKWQFTTKRAPWPRHAAPTGFPPPPRRVTGAGLSVTFIGQASVLIQTGGLNILTDPFFSLRASPVSFAGPRRAAPPGLALKALPPVDVILLSHNHYDHMDLPGLRALHDLFRPRIITPLGNAAIIKRAGRDFAIDEADWGDQLRLAPGLDVTLTPALHWSKRTFYDRNMALWCAFVLHSEDHNAGPVYFAGDTGYGDGRHFRDVRAAFGAPRLALLPIGAYEPRWFMMAQHMNPAEALKAHHDLGAARSLAIHHATIQLTNEAIDAPANALAAAMRTAGVAPECFAVPAAGQTISFHAHQPVLDKARDPVQPAPARSTP